MTISYPLNLPTITGLARVNLAAITSVAINRSPFTFQTQIQKNQGQIWGAEVTLPRMERASAEEWIAFLLSLNGPEGTFRLGDPLARVPRGSIGTGLTVSGAAQTGNTLTITGAPVSTAGVLLPGDYLTVEERLYKVLQSATSNGSGIVTVDIWPRLRASPTNGAVVLARDTTGLFRLSQSTIPIFSSDIEKLYDVSFSAIEAI